MSIKLGIQKKRFSSTAKLISKLIVRRIQVEQLEQEETPSQINERVTSEVYKNILDNIKPEHYNLKSSNLKSQEQKEATNTYKNFYKKKSNLELLADLCRLSEFLYRKSNLNDIADDFANKAIELDSDSVELNSFIDVYKLSHRTKNELELTKLLKSSMQTIKIKITTEEFFIYISIAGILLTITGFAFNYFYYKQYNIDVSLFFTLEDYLSTSLAFLFDLITSSMIGVLATYFGMNHRMNLPKGSNLKSEREFNIIMILTYIILPLVGIIDYVHHKEHRLELYFIIYLMIALRYVPIIALKHFNNGVKAIFIIVFIIFYCGSFCLKLGNALKKDSNLIPKEYTFSFPTQDELQHSIIIGVNSKYVFYKDTINENITIKKSDELDEVNIRQ